MQCDGSASRKEHGASDGDQITDLKTNPVLVGAWAGVSIKLNLKMWRDRDISNW